MKMPYSLVVYDNTGKFKGWVGRPLNIKGSVRWGLASNITFTIDDDHVRAADLKAEGARVEIYRDKEYQVGGWVEVSDGTYAVAGQLTFSVVDFYSILHDWSAWPKPAAALTGQDVAYRTITGPAETVVKTVLAETAARLGYPLIVAPDLGRGAAGTYTFRFHPLYDRLFPMVDQAGIGITVRQGLGGLVVDCVEQRVYPHKLTMGGGTVVGGTYSLRAPTATRVVVGGQGEGVERQFKGFVDTAREVACGRIIEVFRDARDSESADIYTERAAETLAEGAPMSSLSLVLSETKHFRYGGEGLRIGDIVRADANGVTIMDTLREVQLNFGKDGDVATPILGERNDDPDVGLAKQIRALRRGNKDWMVR